jgi:hypothetical protein
VIDVLTNAFIIMIKVYRRFQSFKRPKRSFGLSSDATAITPSSRAHFITNFKKSLKESWRSHIIPLAPWLSLDFFTFHRVVYSRPDSQSQGREAEMMGETYYMIHREIIYGTRSVAKVAQVATITCLSCLADTYWMHSDAGRQ